MHQWSTKDDYFLKHNIACEKKAPASPKSTFELFFQIANLKLVEHLIKKSKTKDL